MSGDLGYKGLFDPVAGVAAYNALAFVVSKFLLRTFVSIPVKVVAVTNDDAVSPVGFVDVQPQVNQVDGYGNATPHGVVHNLPYFRLQGGTDAIIMDPKVGDLGVALFADRDVSSFKATKGISNPGSMRSHDMADGFYFGGFLNGAPVQCVRFAADGIHLSSPNPVVVETDLHVTGAVIAGYGGADQVGLQTHTHPDPQGGDTGSPNAGT